MDCHVAKYAAGDAYVGSWRHARIPRRDDHLVKLADLTTFDCCSHGGMPRVEAADEANHDRQFASTDIDRAAIDTLQVKVDGLLAQHRLSGRHCLLDVVDMGIGRRGDQHGVHIVRIKHGVGRVQRGNREHGCHFVGRGAIDVIDRRQFRSWVRSDVSRMHAPDAPATEHANFQH